MLRKLSLTGALCVTLAAQAAYGSPLTAEQQARLDAAAKAVVGTLTDNCPVAGPGDQAAFDTCRAALHASGLASHFSGIMLWGGGPSGTPIKDLKLTQFRPDLWVDLYLPLYMFTGKYETRYVETEGKYMVAVQALFRNHLDAGQFPYPFWHDPGKWDNWETTNQIEFFLDPERAKIVTALRSPRGERADVAYERVDPRPFDGQWLWQDEQGRLQPEVALFSGIYHADNPYLPELETKFRDLANDLRRSTCMECHVPDNPNGMRRLVLLQTPAHAAAEIERVMRVVREGKMPVEDWGEERPLDPAIKATLLDHGTAFEQVVEQAAQWERSLAEGRAPATTTR
ncbi:MAG TPA: hypothetical protein VK943_11070 [Arenibaculum sp.]|nr:hypothetical protein [Arenibaculum sp.]